MGGRTAVNLVAMYVSLTRLVINEVLPVFSSPHTATRTVEVVSRPALRDGDETYLKPWI